MVLITTVSFSIVLFAISLISFLFSISFSNLFSTLLETLFSELSTIFSVDFSSVIFSVLTFSIVFSYTAKAVFIYGKSKTKIINIEINIFPFFIITS